MERLRNEMDEMRAQMDHLMMKIQVLTHDHGVLKEENGQLKTQMSLIMEVLKTVLRKGNDDVPSTTKVVDLFPPYGSLPIQGMPQRVLSQPQVAKFPRQPVHVPKMSQKGQVYGQRPKMTETVFDPIPIPYAQLLPRLLELQLIELRNLTMPKKLPPDHD